MHKTALRRASLRSGPCRCEAHLQASFRQFHVSTRDQADDAPKSRTQRSQDSFLQISKLPTRSSSAQRSSQPTGFRGREPRERSFRGQQGSTGSYTPRGSRDGTRGGMSGGRGGGAFGTRGGRGGRSGQAGGSHRKRRTGDDEDDGPQQDVEPSNYEIMLEEQGDLYASTDELKGYAHVVDFIDQYNEHQLAMDEKLANPKSDKWEMFTVAGTKVEGNFSETEWAELVAQDRKLLDPAIAEAMDHVIEVDNRWLPHHIPGESWEGSASKGMVGDLPVGPGGMSNLAEEHVRYLAKRVGDKWENPHKLADRLMAGEFVKFRNAPEREEVLALAEVKAYEPGRSGWWAHAVGFEQPEEEAKRALVTRLTSGQYTDPKDVSLKGKVALSAARILNGNATFTAEGKSQFLNKLKELMPDEFTSEKRARA